MLKKILTKKVIIISAIVLVLLILFSGNIFKGKNDGLRTEKVKIGNIIQEVSETGAIKPTQEITLGFKTSGRVSAINVNVGDVVVRGAYLAQLETGQLYTQLNQAEASLAVAQVQYEKTSKNAESSAQQTINDAYQDALNTLNDSYLKLYNAHSAVNSVQSSYFGTSDQEGIKMADNKAIIKDSLIVVKTYLDAAETNEDIDNALSKIIISLNNSIAALKVVRDMCDEGVYYSKVSQADKTSIDNQRSYLITSLTNTIDARQTISSDKLALQKAEDDVDYYSAKVTEAQADISYYQQQIWDATIRAPIAGTITNVSKKAGEMAQATDMTISLISLDPLQIKADIYEEDIVKIKEGNPADINIAAFPDDTLSGKVILVDPAGKLIDGVVYYEITIAFDEIKEGIKPDMTADVVIKTAAKENVLVISKEAIRENGKISVIVLEQGNEVEKEIQLGLEGNDGKVEVISGLSEGDELVIK